MSSNLKLELHTQEDLDQVRLDHNDDILDLLTTTTTTILRSGTIVSTEERRLTLAYEGLVRPPINLLSDYGPIIEILDLSHNSISNLDFLSQFPNLSTLILDHNSVSGDTIFPHLPDLSTLWLNHNRVSSLHPFIHRLGQSCGGLRTLSLMGNEAAPSYLNGGTFYQYLQYRLFVISWLGKLQYLDDRQVTPDQRQEARRLYGRKFMQSLKQSLSLHQYNPSAVLKRFRNLLNNKFGGGGRGQENGISDHNQNEDDGVGGFFGGGEGFLVEEVGVSGFHSDSDLSNSLNNFGSEIAVEFNTDPFLHGTRRRRGERNLVI